MSLFRKAGGFSAESSETTDSSLMNSKSVIRSALIDAIKELQVTYKDATHSSTIATNEDSTLLLNTLEALFIHGLKDSQAGWAKRVATSARASDPSFWTYVLIFSHKDTIKRIDNLKQIGSDVGRSRAWLRLALNDGLLSSYMNTMIVDKTSARRFYERSAILRDPECLDVIAKYITGIEIYKFDLALNSGLLNKWSKTPLTIAGLIQSDSQVIAVAVEAAEEIIEESDEQLTYISQGQEHQNNDEKQPSRSSGYNLKRGLLNEDEALEIILKGGSGFGTPKLGQSPNVSDSPKNGSYTVKNALNVKKPFALRERKSSSSPIENLSESCPTNCQILSSSPQVKLQIYSTNRDELEITKHEAQNECDNISDTISTGISDADKIENDIKLFIPAVEDERMNDESNSLNVKDDHKIYKDSVSSSDSEEEISIYQSSQRKKDYVKESLESSTECFHSHQKLPVLPLISSSNAQDVADSVKISKITPCDTISASDVEDDFTNIIVTATFSPPLTSMSSTTSNTSKEDVKVLPCLSGFIDSWKPFGRTQRFFDTPPDTDSNNVPSFGFRFQRDVTVPGLNVADSQYMLQLFDYIETEKGLDWQNYQCFECTRAIGTIFGPAKLCSYTKRYYCEECHADELAVIPARIVYNWDFKEYRICKKAKVFLNALLIEPILDASTFNLNLFDYSSELKTVSTLRKELKFINAYLSTCSSSQKPNPKKTFDRMLFPRTYLYEDIHKYSIRDLEDVNNGKLKTTMQDVTRYARSHIMGGCILCAGKGFICEVCKDREPLYPFDLNSIVQCEKCFAVFHPECSARLENCPKCDRIEARNLKWHVMMSLNDREHSPVNTEHNSIEIPSN